MAGGNTVRPFGLEGETEGLFWWRSTNGSVWLVPEKGGDEPLSGEGDMEMGWCEVIFTHGTGKWTLVEGRVLCRVCVLLATDALYAAMERMM